MSEQRRMPGGRMGHGGRGMVRERKPATSEAPWRSCSAIWEDISSVSY